MDNLCCFQLGGRRSSSGSGKGRSHQGPAKYGFSLVKGKANHPMEDFHVAKFIQFHGRELGLFAIYDGHLGDTVPAYLQKHLFSNILKEEDFWTDPNRSIAKAYERTDEAILSHNPDLGRGGSTAVTAIVINCRHLWLGIINLYRLNPHIGMAKAHRSGAAGKVALLLSSHMEGGEHNGASREKHGFQIATFESPLRLGDSFGSARGHVGDGTDKGEGTGMELLTRTYPCVDNNEDARGYPMGMSGMGRTKGQGQGMESST
ncbi:unnamed protein product [Fraxinus pennsylvanica]|uniref:PPM-type phosphatase domain-containing protein n=1 Tax=Fraxinus pennsylvanica TaxID=56036 RepID=A0AAD2EBT2_9LAMI|nr:unnamed protein product [Fraxinus pennsylvanica]